MALKIETEQRSLDHIARFYDELAAHYDEMTGFSQRFVKEKPFFHLLVERHRIKTAMDAGSGTGFHSLLLAQLGVKVTAVDISSEMLRRAQRHARELGLSITTVESRLEDLAQNAHGPFDAVFTLGNTLPHLLSDESLRTTLNNFSAVLKPAGLLVIQVLNYDRILSLKEPVQSSRTTEKKTYIRSYDFKEDLLVFNIVTRTGNEAEKKQSIELRPLRSRELLTLLETAGFVDARAYGAISLVEFSPETSEDLVVIARKGE